MLLFFAIGQPVSIGISAVVGSSFTRDNPEGPVLVPPGPAFSIWGLIVTLTGVYSLWQFFARTDAPGRASIAGPLAVAAVGFSVWLGLASLPALTALTVPVFVVMGAALVLAARAARDAATASWPRWARGVLWGALGTYLGWTAVAVWLNLSTTLVDAGAPLDRTWGTTWQLLLAAAAAGTAVALLLFTRTVSRALCWVFGLTTVYALAFAAVGAATRGAPVASAVAAVLAAAVAIATVFVAQRPTATTRTAARGRALA
ncbi:hypothetical protein [Curtobacterium sp. TXMA1]|uniref:hypothetical protein n=1 Tax=Curtobacterium sp. TXMA1 TaxID=2876939 RepID=UPI001CCEFCC5|nr:hypothetical protein [Curtobacterium sp. TXMA1]UBQ02962.1 hypothetical protein LCG91_01955 [Curtobacterium sp. TXMA1]